MERQQEAEAEKETEKEEADKKTEEEEAEKKSKEEGKVWRKREGERMRTGGRQGCPYFRLSEKINIAFSSSLRLFCNVVFGNSDNPGKEEDDKDQEKRGSGQVALGSTGTQKGRPPAISNFQCCPNFLHHLRTSLHLPVVSTISSIICGLPSTCSSVVQISKNNIAIER